MARRPCCATSAVSQLPICTCSTCRLAEEGDEDLDEDEVLLARMDAGLYTLQQVGAPSWVLLNRDAAVAAAVGHQFLARMLTDHNRLQQLLARDSQHASHAPHALPAVQCALVVGALWLVGDQGVRKRILKLLHQKGRTLASLRSVLLELRANIGDEGDRWLFQHCVLLVDIATDCGVCFLLLLLLARGTVTIFDTLPVLSSCALHRRR